MRVRRIVLFAIAVLMPQGLGAQPVPGDRVRIGYVNGGEVTGTLVEATPETLRVREGDVVTEVARSEVGSLERSLGVRDDFGRNFLVSVAVSAVVVGGVMAASGDDSDLWGRDAAFAIGAIGGGIIGIPIGLITGLASRSERWARVDLPPGADFALLLDPALGRLGLTVRLPIPTDP